jgi:hypothetical protein
MKKLILLFTVFIGVTTLSCSSDNNDEFIITVNTSDAVFAIDENPTNNQEIGTVQGTTNQGSVIFSIVDQSPNNAFAINATNGKLTVLDETLFDFETTTIITGIIKVANGEISSNANITININDIDETIYHGDVILTTQEEINAFSANNYITIDGDFTIDENQTIHDILNLEELASITTINGVFTIQNLYNLLDVPSFQNITSVGGINISNNWGILDIHSLLNITTNTGSITITNNPELGGFCGIRPLLQSGNFFGDYNVSGNYYNPTLQEIIDGNCEGEDW